MNFIECGRIPLSGLLPVTVRGHVRYYGTARVRVRLRVGVGASAGRRRRRGSWVMPVSETRTRIRSHRPLSGLGRRRPATAGGWWQPRSQRQVSRHGQVTCWRLRHVPTGSLRRSLSRGGHGAIGHLRSGLLTGTSEVTGYYYPRGPRAEGRVAAYYNPDSKQPPMDH